MLRIFLNVFQLLHEISNVIRLGPNGVWLRDIDLLTVIEAAAFIFGLVLNAPDRSISWGLHHRVTVLILLKIKLVVLGSVVGLTVTQGLRSLEFLEASRAAPGPLSLLHGASSRLASFPWAVVDLCLGVEI